MAQINSTGSSTRKRAGVQRVIRHHLKVDMTPMVDLGFLLITFFVMTAELSKPTAMDLFMPKDGPEMPLGESNALTLLLNGDRVYYYEGKWEVALMSGAIIETNLSGDDDLRQAIQRKQQLLDVTTKDKEGRDGLMVLIKAGRTASYKKVVDVLDEMAISRVKKYTLVKHAAYESTWLMSKHP